MYIINTSKKEVKKQTSIDNTTARGYEPRYSHNGNTTATKGDIVPLANYIAYINMPTVTAITREGATDAETLRTIDSLIVQP